MARLKIIYENGGVYLDTDCELKSSLNDLLNNEAWFAYGTDTEINTGSGFGAESGNWMVKELLDTYLSFEELTPFDLCTRIDTAVFNRVFPGFAADHDVTQEYNGVVIINNIWKYVTHHYTGTWMTKKQKVLTKLLNPFPTKLKKFLKDFRRKLFEKNKTT